MNYIRAVDLKSLEEFPDDVLQKLLGICKEIEKMLTPEVADLFNVLAEGKLPLSYIANAKRMLLAIKQISEEEWFNEYGFSNLFQSYSIKHIQTASQNALIQHSRKELVLISEQMLDCIVSAFKETIPFVTEQSEITNMRNSLDTMSKESNPILNLVIALSNIHQMYNWMIDTSKSLPQTIKVQNAINAFGLKTAFLSDGIHGYFSTDNKNLIEYNHLRVQLLAQVEALMMHDIVNVEVLQELLQTVNEQIISNSTQTNNMQVNTRQELDTTEKSKNDESESIDDLLDDLLAF